MRQLINKFPREVGTPRKKFCRTEKDLYDFLNKHNGITGCHVSILHCDEQRKYHDTSIDQIIPELDDNALEQALRMHDELMKMVKGGIKHLFIYSGNKSIHPWVFCKDNKNIKVKSDCLTNVISFFKNTLKFDVDEHFKELNKTIRIPNSWNLIGERFCIPIVVDDIKAGWEHIKKKAHKQNFYYKFYGEKLLDLKPFDFPTPRPTMLQEVPAYEYVAVEKDGMVKHLLPCLQMMLLEPKEYCKYDSRRLFALGCREHGLPPDTCRKLAKKYWGSVKDHTGRKTKYQEFIEEKVIDFVYKSPEMYFPNCDTNFTKGFCRGKCKEYKKRGSPLYD